MSEELVKEMACWSQAASGPAARVNYQECINAISKNDNTMDPVFSWVVISLSAIFLIISILGYVKVKHFPDKWQKRLPIELRDEISKFCLRLIPVSLILLIGGIVGSIYISGISFVSALIVIGLHSFSKTEKALRIIRAKIQAENENQLMKLIDVKPPETLSTLPPGRDE